jgi:hypothetical protein
MTGRLIAGLLMTVLSLPGSGQSQDRYAITAGQIARALTARGMWTSQKQVSLLASVVSTEPDPVLQVISVAPLGDTGSTDRIESRSQVKMGCQMPGRCLPFYALVSLSKERTDNGAGASAVSAAPWSAALKSNAGITMRAGTHATLLMDDGRSHVQVSVVSLQSGVTGHRIRVASADRKQVYVGEVVGPNLLRRSY